MNNLYQEIILDLNNNPKCYGKPRDFSRHVTQHNEICGDTVDLFATIHEEYIQDLYFTAECCAITKASASLMAHSLASITLKQASSMQQAFLNMVSGKGPHEAILNESLKIFKGLAQFPARQHCAILPWLALENLLQAPDVSLDTQT
jgi:nitrogen fixation protein NifU and related proteins